MTVEDMEDLLDRLGVEYFNIRGFEINGSCPAHLQRTGNEDHNPSWWINADTGAHICFSCGFKGSVTSLIEYVQGIDFESAKAWISDGVDLGKALDKATRKEPVLKEVTDISEANLAAFVDPPEHALRSRGITLEAARLYGISWDNHKQCWITPIRNPIDGKLWGWQEKGSNRYFRNYPTGVNKSLGLFGYGQYKGGPMIVVESPLDVARMASVGVFGGVSTYGAAVSKSQINLIRGAESVIFAMDNDKAGRESSKALLGWSLRLGFEARFFNYDHVDIKDVGGMSKDEITLGLETARHSVYGEKALGYA
jgi:DNA primase